MNVENNQVNVKLNHVRLKYVSLINPSKSEAKMDKNLQVSFIPMENIKSAGEVDLSIEKSIEDVYSGYTYFKSGDIIMAKVTPCFENGNIAIVNGLKNGVGFGTTELHVIRANDEIIKNEFLYYFLQSDEFKSKAVSTMYGVGGLKRIPSEFLENAEVPLPNKSIQKEIVRFLNDKTCNINSLIKDKEALIQLLEEKRQAIITEAVTKGLNPNVKMKDSGVEWIGEIPEHWTIKRLKNVVSINPNKSEVTLKENERVTFLPMEKILAPGQLDISLEKDLSEVYSGYTYFKNEDIVMAKVTPCFENGNIAIANDLINGVGFGTTELHVLRTKSNQSNKFYYYFLQSEPFKQEGVAMMYGVGGLKRIPTEFIVNYKLAIPPIREQIIIADYLDEKCKEIFNLKSEIKNQIHKLKEYRQSLIYEAVTGKIDVRDIEINL